MDMAMSSDPDCIILPQGAGQRLYGTVQGFLSYVTFSKYN